MAIFHVLILQMLLVSLSFSGLGLPQQISHTFSLAVGKSGGYWCEWVLRSESRLEPLLETQSYSAKSSLYTQRKEEPLGRLIQTKQQAKGM